MAKNRIIKKNNDCSMEYEVGDMENLPTKMHDR